jgi:hypothetical protein
MRLEAVESVVFLRFFIRVLATVFIDFSAGIRVEDYIRYPYAIFYTGLLLPDLNYNYDFVFFDCSCFLEKSSVSAIE